MNEEADVAEVVEAIERLRKGYQKPLPGALEDQTQQTASTPSDNDGQRQAN